MLSKEDIKKLSDLSRIEIKESEEEKLRSDLEKILDYFNNLKKLNTEDEKPVVGGSFINDVYRVNETQVFSNEEILSEFPEKKENFLKIPPVFE